MRSLEREPYAATCGGTVTGVKESKPAHGSVGVEGRGVGVEGTAARHSGRARKEGGAVGMRSEEVVRDRATGWGWLFGPESVLAFI